MKCRNIKYFYWFGNSLDTVRRIDRDTPFSLITLLQGCLKLQYIWFYDVFLELETSKNCDPESDLISFIRKFCPNLKMLKTINCHVLGSFEKLVVSSSNTTSWTFVREELRNLKIITFLDVGFQVKWQSKWISFLGNHWRVVQ